MKGKDLTYFLPSSKDSVGDSTRTSRLETYANASLVGDADGYRDIAG